MECENKIYDYNKRNDVADVVRRSPYRRIIGKENQQAHMLVLRERAANAPKAPVTHKEPVDLDRTDTDVISIHGVAKILFCSVQSARNIPTDELTRYLGPGRPRLYFREDVMRYARERKADCFEADELMRQIESGQLELSMDSGSRHCRRSNCNE